MLDSRYKFHASEQHAFIVARMCTFDHSHPAPACASGTADSQVHGSESQSTESEPWRTDERLVLQMLDHALRPDDASTNAHPKLRFRFRFPASSESRVRCNNRSSNFSSSTHRLIGGGQMSLHFDKRRKQQTRARQVLCTLRHYIKSRLLTRLRLCAEREWKQATSLGGRGRECRQHPTHDRAVL